MQQTLNYAALYNAGQPILLLDAIENNFNAFNARMQTLGLPTAGTAKEAFSLLEANGGQMTLNDFLLLFDYQYIETGQNQALTDAFYKQSGLSTPRPGNLSTFSWSKVWKNGFENYFLNAFGEDQEAVVIEQNNNENLDKKATEKTILKTEKLRQKISSVNMVLFVFAAIVTTITIFKFSKK